jgi:Holliday junction DNA helicase RuvB
MTKEKSKLPLVEMNSPEPREVRVTGASTNGPSNGSVSENILRPKRLGEYIGQKAVAAKLEVFIQAAKARGQALDHVLLSGPPGLGKTTLAHIVAFEMGGRLHQAPGPTLEKSADLLSILSELKAGDVLFIDEIHRLSPAIEEALYPAMEDFQVQLIVGEGPSAQSVTLNLERFTLIGATTQPGKITGPLRDRFGIHLGLDFYDIDEMRQILKRSAGILDIRLSADEIAAVAARARGTPRIGNRLLARVRDFVEVMRNSENAAELSTRAQDVVKNASVSKVARNAVELVKWALDFLDVDRRGLQPLDRRYLQVLMEQFRGGPAGVEALAASLSEDRSTLEETVEPYLLKEGLIVRTARGRMATDAAYEHLGLVRLGGPTPDLDSAP